MPVTDTSASLTTARRRQLALFGWRNGKPVGSIVKEQNSSYGFQGTGPSDSVPLNVFVGAQLVGQMVDTCACSPRVTTEGYVKKAPAQCRGNTF